MEKETSLFLEDQLCFPIYATSRMITRMYQPFLEEIGLTYPQYLAMLVLWEKDEITVGQLGRRMLLNTNTITPILQKLKQKKIITKQRSKEDERVVTVKLTEKGILLKEKAASIPKNLIESINYSPDELTQIREIMWKFLRSFEAENA